MQHSDIKILYIIYLPDKINVDTPSGYRHGTI